MTIIKKLDFSPQGNDTVLISSADLKILGTTLKDYHTQKNNEFHCLNLMLFSIPYDFNRKIKEPIFMLAPASSASELNYILYCPQKNPALPPHIKKIEYCLSIDKESGIATLQKLKQPKIIKTIEIESDDELSNSDNDSEFDLDEDTNSDQYKGFESAEHQCSPALGTADYLIKTPVREVYESDFEGSFNLTETELNNLQANSFYSTDEDYDDWSDSYDDSSENEAQLINQSRFYQDEFSDDSISDIDECGSPDINYSRFIKDTTSTDMRFQNNTNQSKITFFKIPSDSRRELACRKKLYPTKDNLQIIATKESCYIIDDFVEGKTLSDILKDMHKNPIDYSNQRILNLVKLSIQAMYFVRSHGVTHGDFKPENIIISLSETTARVIDFGGSVVIPEDNMLLQKKVKDFTLHYVPPEQQHEISHEQLTATETLDLNAAALIVVFLCAGYGYDDCGLDERRLKYNLFRNKEKKYDSYITKWSDHIKSDVNHPHDIELQKDLNKIASTISSFGATGPKLQALFDRILAEIPENRGTFSQLLDEVIQIEKNYEEPLRARRLSF